MRNMTISSPPCKRVLIVEDDFDTLYTLAELLHVKGVEVIHAASTLVEAERALASGFRPSAVILDLGLGDERGETLLGMLRANAEYRAVRIIALSGDRIGLLRVREAVDATLLKPAELGTVIQVLREVCASLRTATAPCAAL